MTHDARCPCCHKALLLKWTPTVAPTSLHVALKQHAAALETSCRSCRALVSFKILPDSTRPQILDFRRRDEPRYALR